MSPAVAAFVGTWKAVASEDRLSDGRLVPTEFGPRPTGYLVYDAHGHMAGQVMNPARPNVSLRGAAPEQLRAAVLGFVAYSGRYSVDEAAGTVTHHVECALHPRMVGSDQVRLYDFTGDQLTLRVPPFEASGVTHNMTLVWKRVK